MGPEPGGAWSWKLFELGFRPWLRRNLSGIHIEGLPDPPPTPSLPLLLIANHTSWFDGFLLREVQRRLRPSGVLRTVMLRRELRGRPILRFIGGTGFDPERPQSLRGTLRELAELRERASLTISFFPQGRIRPSWSEALGFRPGVELLQRTLSPAVILPVGLHLEMGNRARPSAFISVGPPVDLSREAGQLEVGTLEELVIVRLQRIRRHIVRHGESAPDHWPPAVQSSMPS